MYQCESCKRYLKYKYYNCPGCNSGSIKQVGENTITKITEVPEGGYKLNLSNFKKNILTGIIFLAFGLLIITIIIIFIHNISVELIFIGPFILIGFVNILYYINHKKRLETLSKTGVLIKNLDYTIEKTNVKVNNQRIYCLQVMYDSPSGQTIPLRSEGKYEDLKARTDKTVDLLIDPNNEKNYFIDFEIF